MYKKLLLAPVAFLFFICSCVSGIFADELTIANESEVLYGAGVHAFFDGDYKKAIEIFDKVESLGSEDPRPYFFAAIARYRLDVNSADADKYFKKASTLEWQGKNLREYDVPESLRRIQGNERLHIEKYRTQAKIIWQKTKTTQDKIKYGTQIANDKNIVAEVSKAFVGNAEFGAKTPDPFKDDDKNNNAKNKNDDRLKAILEGNNPVAGSEDVIETIDVHVENNPNKTYDAEAIAGTIQQEGEMIIEDDDIFAEFDDDQNDITKNTDDIKITEKTEPLKEPNPKTEPETTPTPETNTETKIEPKPETEPEAEPDSNEPMPEPLEPTADDESAEPIIDPESAEPIVNPEPTKPSNFH
ncbi:MAG: hypothetical protein LBP59_01485 [Planctomycetaceae bacterium]|jgi:hypothetical protein|nr:hypothetical protein [Planctomycetaceae bacterium]